MRTIAIVSNNRAKRSETFIHAQVRLLPGPLHYLTTGWLPTRVSLGWSGVDRPLLEGGPDPDDDRAGLEAAIARHLIESRVDVVLAQYGLSGVEMLGPCASADVPLVVHFHGFDAYRGDILESFAAGYRELFRVAAALIVPSEHMAAHLGELGARRDRLRVIPYGIDPAVFAGADPATSEPTFVAVGRLVPKKDPLKTLRAFGLVHDRVPGARLVLIGDGPLRAACETLIRSAGLEDAVELRGELAHAEVARAMGEARAFVQHSVRAEDGDGEGTPVAVLEASSAGLPVIATRHHGIPEVVADGEGGCLVAEGDVEGMARAMIRLARDPQEAARLGRGARERVHATHRLTDSIASIDRVLTEVGRPGG